MAKRGRKSAVALSVLPMADPSEVESVSRPVPPECASVWATRSRKERDIRRRSDNRFWQLRLVSTPYGTMSYGPPDLR